MRTCLARGRLHLLVLATALALVAPADALRAQRPEIDVTRFTHELGLVVAEARKAHLAVGDAVTGSAMQPALLQRLGINGMHRGARVVIARVAPDHVTVEVDELLPAPQRAAVKLRVGDDGTLQLP
ncbi:MAG: hypothetical protein HOQ11_07240 [Gemmatimonadaceae bacterium]|nr:hypothetical protein [Gemmatimonadaceae bacterium]NUQ93195.1 hypothetical protein [Gemmatimonadaceae bacterium]NUR18896.1 hypothetical protein [Gemmatimonadaceae bacterium]NUS97186.1 hypothetical protein [Gemmatimonadaceae bacterium]